MKDSELAKINFQEILDYHGQPKAKNSYLVPLNCHGYCISCEKSGLLKQTGGRLDLMSHGCDSSDFEDVLGKQLFYGEIINYPVLFLLENPGEDYGNGKPVEFNGFTKKPPVNHYYWTPNITSWPDRIEQFNGNFYGPYFAYLMRKHHLNNVYITNLIKCKWVKGEDNKVNNDSLLRQHCITKYLKSEIKIFSPRIAFCFGRNAENGFKTIAPENCKILYLMHPSYIANRYQTTKYSQEELVERNDDRIRQALENIA